MAYPIERLRRLRHNPMIREIVRETFLRASQLVQPLFVRAEITERREIRSMPGQFQLPPGELVREAQSAWEAGVRSVILFGIPARKDPQGTEAWRPDGVIPEAIHAIKQEIPTMCVIADVCLCEYTDHGHCGIVSGTGGEASKEWQIDNDKTLEALGRTAVAYARAGADIVAPSAMMDGQVGAIRKGLSDAGLDSVLILAYAAKFASRFYGPFREAAESPPRFGDRASYQMDPGNPEEALREISLDIEEGADIVMVKPALAYLDVLARARQAFRHPLAAYSVSGEYAMVEAAARNGWIDRKGTILEILLAIRRAGADLVLTYWAKEAAGWLHERKS